mmetsp:Transcript_57656/g.108486  ORF Transcript_57656/g.108486 Transcript_57656/m.108486 type:complete len:203 (-) Transcript_57656:4-612(-)
MTCPVCRIISPESILQRSSAFTCDSLHLSTLTSQLISCFGSCGGWCRNRLTAHLRHSLLVCIHTHHHLCSIVILLRNRSLRSLCSLRRIPCLFIILLLVLLFLFIRIQIHARCSKSTCQSTPEIDHLWSFFLSGSLLPGRLLLSSSNVISRNGFFCWKDCRQLRRKGCSSLSISNCVTNGSKCSLICAYLRIGICVAGESSC